MEQLAGRVAFITGGGRGIGLAIAHALAREGVRLAIADISVEALEAAGESLATQTETCVYQLDVRDRQAFHDIADRVQRDLGQVSLLFNNAGVASKMSVRELSYQTWDWSLGINLGGVVNGIQTFLPRMLQLQEGHIVNTASAAGLVVAGKSSGFLYPTAKFAVVGMSEGLRAQLEPHGIGVSVLCPGAVATDLYDNTVAEHAASEAGDWDAHLERLRGWLRSSTPPETVGQLVVDGIRTNQKYILTDRVSEEAIVARAKELLEALPALPSSPAGR